MAKRQRLLLNVALSYVVVSVLLFCIFVVTYRGYWYRIQEQMVVTRARQNEKIFLNAVAEAFHASSEVLKVQREMYESNMKWIAKIRLMDLMRRFDEAAKPFIAPEPTAVANTRSTGFIEPEVEARERLKKLLQPVKPAQDEENIFLDILAKFNEENKGRILIKHFAPGYEQMVELSLISVESKVFKVKINEKQIEWELRSYVEPYKEGKISHDAILERFMQQDVASTKRMGVYKYGDKTPLYLGKDHQLDAGKLGYFEEKGAKQGQSFFESPEPLVVNGLYEGGEVLQILLNSFYTDPELRLTFVLNKVISEPEWTQFGFFERNKVPILLYVVLAWLVCPLLFWWGINKSNRFQFQLTADLDGDDDESVVPLVPRDDEGVELRKFKRPSVETPSVPMAETLLSPVETVAPSVVEPSVSVPHESLVEQKVHKESSSHKETSDRSVGPLTRRLQEEQVEKMSIEKSSQSDVALIRLNNIRKSSGSYNRHVEAGETTDFLAGVQSDVLKSLIKKLRDD